MKLNLKSKLKLKKTTSELNTLAEKLRWNFGLPNFSSLNRKFSKLENSG
jgi:hypothetical protein